MDSMKHSNREINIKCSPQSWEKGLPENDQLSQEAFWDLFARSDFNLPWGSLETRLYLVFTLCTLVLPVPYPAAPWGLEPRCLNSWRAQYFLLTGSAGTDKGFAGCWTRSLSQLFHSLSVWAQTGHSTSLCLGFPSCMQDGQYLLTPLRHFDLSRGKVPHMWAPCLTLTPPVTSCNANDASFAVRDEVFLMENSTTAFADGVIISPYMIEIKRADTK